MRDIADPVPDSNEAIGISAEESTKCQELVLQGPTAAESVHAPLPQSSSAILVPLSPVGVRINEEDFPALEAAAIGISGSPGSKEPPDKNQRSSKKKKKRSGYIKFLSHFACLAKMGWELAGFFGLLPVFSGLFGAAAIQLFETEIFAMVFSSSFGEDAFCSSW
ncbi:hypothetical protein U1Q18_003302 [Sarracenia purpurea var. burkii]